MAKEKTSEKWIHAGYDLLAREGLPGVHIERIARILNLNKSSFYHHFGTLEIFYERLVLHHYKKIDLAILDTLDAQDLDPDYLNEVVKHQVAFMAQVQFTRNKSNPLFSDASVKVNERIDLSVIQLWIKHLGLTSNDELALRYLGLVRDMFYTRISFENFHYDFLHELASEAKNIVEEIQQDKTFVEKFDLIGLSKRPRLGSKREFD